MERWFKTGSRCERDNPNCEKISACITNKCKGKSATESQSNICKYKSGNAKKQQTCLRKYNQDCLNHGFLFLGTKEKPIPQYVICCENLSNRSMKPTKLEGHLSTKLPESTKKSLEFF